jgi:hypothetical protein
MLEVGIITSDSADNKLYYEINQRYEYYVPFRAIFADERIESVADTNTKAAWHELVTGLAGVRLAILAGVLVKGSGSSVDLLLVGDIPSVKLKNVIKQIEKIEARELNYTVVSYDEFYYRLSVRDKFITEILAGKHTVLLDTDDILKG